MNTKFFSLILLSILLTSCGKSLVRNSSTTLKSSSYAQETLDVDNANLECTETALHQNLSVTGAGIFKACRSPSLKTVMTLEGYYENVSQVCVFPLQTYKLVSGGIKQVYKLDAYGAPYSECGALNNDQVMRVNFANTTFDSIIIVPKSERVNMQTCLKSNINCTEYSFGKWE